MLKNVLIKIWHKIDYNILDQTIIIEFIKFNFLVYEFNNIV